MKNVIFFTLLILLPSLCWSTWIWSPEVGWINSKYDPQGTASSLYEQAQKMMEQKEYGQAAQIFQNITKMYPNSSQSKNSLYLAAKCRFYAEDYYASYLLYEEYISLYPDTENLQEILEKEYEIGAILIRSNTKSSSILSFSSSATLGVEILEKLLQNAPYLKFADDARLTIANYYYKELEYKLAQENYEKLIQEYPKSEWVSFAHYQISACHLKQFQSIDYDSKPLVSAKEKLTEYLEKFPQGQQSQVAQEKKKEVIELLAQKELAVAKFYHNKGEKIATILYLAYIMKKFEGTQTAQQAKLMMSQIQGKENP